MYGMLIYYDFTNEDIKVYIKKEGPTRRRRRPPGGGDTRHQRPSKGSEHTALPSGSSAGIECHGCEEPLAPRRRMREATSPHTSHPSARGPRPLANPPTKGEPPRSAGRGQNWGRKF